MRIPRLIGQIIVTFVLASAIVPLVVVAVPATRRPGLGYLSVACVFGAVFGVLRTVWPKPPR